MKKLLLICLSLMVFLPCTIQAQKNTPFKKEYFKGRLDAYKTAKDEYDQGYEKYKQGEYMYTRALPHFLKAQKFNPDYGKLNYMIGRCYLKSSEKSLALPYFEKAYQLNKDVSDDILFYMGWAYQLDYQFSKANVTFNKYKTSIKDKEEIEKAEKHIKECSNGLIYMLHPKRVFIDDLGAAVNTEYPEYDPKINADETTLMFTSRRASTTGGEIPKGSDQYFEDVYYSTKINGKWQLAKNIGPPINTKGHDAIMALSQNGQKMILYNDKKGNGDLSQSALEGDDWSTPVPMTEGSINTKYHESSASFSPDGKIIYFISNRKGGYGERDIWKSAWNDEKEKWGDAENLGATINTKYNEESVFMHPDGRTLYFSSEGHTSMGGYDIFTSVKQDDGSWSTPEDIGYPINTPDDDVFFVLGASGRRGYYSSIKKDGFGDKDIYMITFLGPEKLAVLTNEDNLIASDFRPVKNIVKEKPAAIITKRLTLLTGTVKDKVSLKPLRAKIELIDLEKNKTIAVFYSNSSSGKYLVSLPAGRNYGINIREKGYLFYSDHFDVPDTAAYQKVVRNVLLQKLVPGSKIVLKNIFYDFDKATLRKESISELNHVIALMNDYPSLRIELSAYTDQRGSDAYNLKLSQERAQSCVDYLIKKGIVRKRLVVRGYGEKEPINSLTIIKQAKTKEEKEQLYQENRRTEIKVVAN